MQDLIPQEVLENKIFLIRKQKVMIDRDLAELYDVETKTFNRAVKRNSARFPADFMFQLTKEEAESLRYQFGTSKTSGSGGRRYLPYAFTEQGVSMLSGILNSKRAVKVNIEIMRTFVKLREILSTHKELAHKLKTLEHKTDKHDKEIYTIFEALRQLMTSPEKPKKQIGFNRK